MIEEFTSFITTQQLFSPQDRILLAVSGGIDSVVMLDLFAHTDYSFAVVHCNFSLRGKASEEDEMFVRTLAQNYGVPCFVKRFDTVGENEQTKESIQMTARRLRYAWFTALLQQENYQYIATAHHKNDVLETLLFNLCKGTGIAGLHGILPKSGDVIRPMLFTERKTIKAYLQEHGLSWREDSSNASVKYARNLIRLEVVPRLLKINPNLFTTLDSTLERLQGAEQMSRQHIAEVKRQSVTVKGEDVFMALAPLRREEALPLVLYELLKPYGFHYAQARTVASLMKSQHVSAAGKVLYTAQYKLNIDREQLLISPRREQAAVTCLLHAHDKILTVNPFFRLNTQVMDAGKFSIVADPKVAALDMEKLIFPLQLRPWQAGDWFYPLGMKGKKKLSDFMIDHKIPLNLKDRVYVLTSGEAIVWVLGYRIDERYKITQTTRQVLQILQQDIT